MNGKADHDQIIRAIELCRATGLGMACLALAYTLIDSLAWLLYGDLAGGCRERFTKWVDRFLLPVLPYDCTALDLYGARCAILHTLSSESHLISAGCARPLLYSIGVSRDEMERAAEVLFPGRENVNLDIAELIPALRSAVERFELYLQENSLALPEVAQRREKKYVFLSQDELSQLVEAIETVKDSPQKLALEGSQDLSCSEK